MEKLIKISRWVGENFIFWALGFALIGFIEPSAFAWVRPHINFILGLIMFGMGLTLTPADFKILGEHPKAVLIGAVSQFLFMPLIAWLLAKALNLPSEIAIGVILVGCCPGGTASNVITFLARGNVALSVAVTSITTLLAPIMTPLIFWLLAHNKLDINAMAMFQNIVQVVLLPVLGGAIINRYFHKSVEKTVEFLPIISVFGIAVIIGFVIGGSKATIINQGVTIFLVVIVHNLLGLLAGFWTAKVLGLPYDAQKTLSIEVGMQNSGLAVSLAKLPIFASMPLVAVPGALFSLWHNVSGALLASYWRKKAEKLEANQ